ncbi:MAG: hypothetical protein M1814_003819 [Vezdaea aestivalis]|nr:MAG: hypothetical protein M1814_003819 [Vezdaea aestivalis]
MEAYRSETVATTPLPAPSYEGYYHDLNYAPVTGTIADAFRFETAASAGPYVPSESNPAGTPYATARDVSSSLLPLGYVVGHDQQQQHDSQPTPQSYTSTAGTVEVKAPSSISTVTPPPVSNRKRARKSGKQSGSSNDEDGGKKKRGRPRLVADDTNTSDRRRTQIRLAQRSYRLRKEGTIATLTKRCEKLQKTIEDMNKSFLGLTDKFLADGPSNHLAPEVKATTEHFLELARKSTQELDGDVGAEVDKLEVHVEENGTDAGRVKNESQSPPARVPQIHASWGQLVPHTSTHASTPQSLPVNQVAITISSPQPTIQLNPTYSFDFQVDPALGLDHAQQRFNANLAYQLGSPIERYLPMPPTHTPMESSFVRRIQRRALEKALYVLITPGIPDWMVTHVFKLSFCSTNRNDIITRLKFLLAASDQETLDYINVPFWHLGGSGTHFQEEAVGQGGLAMCNRAAQSVRSVGPFALNKQERAYENVGGQCDTPEMMVQLTGFDGEWFDAADIERLLRQRGRNIEPSGQYYEVMMSPPGTPSVGEGLGPEINDSESVPQSMMAPSVESGQSLPGPYTPAGDSVSAPASTAADGTYQSESAELDFGLQQNEFQMPVSGVNQTAASLVFMANDLSSATVPKQVPVPSNQTLMTIEITRFIEELTGKAICLGRSPGFRRSSIEEALTAAVVDITDES